MTLHSDAPTVPHDLALSAGQGRRARLVADLIVWLLPPVYLAVTAVLVRSGALSDALIFGNLFTPAVSALVAFYSATGWHVQVSGEGLLTARTLSGRRTVDLTRLTKVGRIEVPGQVGSPDDRLILTDAHGVRLIVHKVKGGTGTVDRTVRRALLERPVDAGVILSAQAADRLDLTDEVERANRKMVPGRSVPDRVHAWMPILSLLAFAPVCIGLLLAGYVAAGSP
ncbi:hypothetical protein ACIBI4_06615 [Streptomyces sp. NPDC050418]|uniref:hypothetical protein n=1 Tax=Streptomyces sp. NPDC050418 TaxID=3365612 RepID=UPI0037902C26